MDKDFGLIGGAVEKNETSTKSAANPFLQPPMNDLSPHAQPKWFLTSLPTPRLETVLRPHDQPNRSNNNESLPFSCPVCET